MKFRIKGLRWIASVFIVVSLGMAAVAQTAPATTTASTGLIGSLTKGLSVTPTQAKGGAGALFGLAKSRLSADEFGKVSSAVPGMSSLLKAAPVSGQSSELSALEGSMPGNLGTLASVASAFHKLGMSPEMAGKFVPVMTKYVEARGGSSTAGLLDKAWK